MTDARQNQAMPIAKRRVIIVTGMSGAGKSSALHAFEDLGYQSVDNLPLDLIGGLLGSRNRDKKDGKDKDEQGGK